MHSCSSWDGPCKACIAAEQRRKIRWLESVAIEQAAILKDLLTYVEKRLART